VSLVPDVFPPVANLPEDLDLSAEVARVREELALTRSEIEAGIERAEAYWGSVSKRLSGAE